MSCSFRQPFDKACSYSYPSAFPFPLPLLLPFLTSYSQHPLIVQNVLPFPIPRAMSANQRSISRTCLKYALTHRATTESGTHTKANGAGYCHRQTGRLSLGQITPRSALPRCGLKHPPKNDFIFNINCSNRVTMAATTTLGIGRDATLLDTPQPAAKHPRQQQPPGRGTDGCGN